METDSFDAYEISARYYDLFIQGKTNANRTPSATFFLQVARGASSVLDLGAGTGRLALALAEQGAQVFAAEPSGAMRDQFDKRLAANPRAARRVTLLTQSTRDFALPTRCDVIILSGVLQHVPADERPTLLRRVAAYLQPGGRFVTDMVGEAPPEVEVSARIGDVTVKGLRYMCDLRVRPIGDEKALLTFSYHTVNGQGPLPTEVVKRVRHFVSREQMTHELSSAGLAVIPQQALTGIPAEEVPHDAIVAGHAKR